MKEKNNSSNYNDKKKQHNWENEFSKRNSEKWNKRAESNPRVKEKKQTSLEKQ